MPAIRIPNEKARRLWLHAHGLLAPPVAAPPTDAVIQALGFVQLDTIQIVSRAHHHILWSRDQTYREPRLDKLLRQRKVFEHFTHDASVLPMDMLPLWQRQFERRRQRVIRWAEHLGDARDGLGAQILNRIRDEGALCTRDFDTQIDGPRAMWDRPPHKLVLDYLWFAGVLATCHRDGFIKHYDLAERVFPKDLRETVLSDADQITGLCRAALTRLGFGTEGEVRKFWEATAVDEVAAWADRDRAHWVPVEIEGADRSWTKAMGAADIEARLAVLPDPIKRMRILNPFDPAIRDRTRLNRLFGFDYTVEMFVPAAKRQWGYYIFPLLEGDRLVGRLEAKAVRAKGRLDVTRLWWETGVRRSTARVDRLNSELGRPARLAGVSDVVWHSDPMA